VDLALGMLAFWPALALGSFVNVVAARVPLKRSVVPVGMPSNKDVYAQPNPPQGFTG